MILALSKIEFFWGVCERWINLKEEDKDFEIYTPGNIVTWIQFSSAAEKDGNIKHFKKRNTKFIIRSLKGRNISQFSTFYGEKEVLFTPFSRFLVIGKRQESFKEEGEKYHYTAIYMREIEVGLNNCKPVMWVDDNILNP